MRLEIRKPDDWHIHLRDGEMLRAVLPYTTNQMGRAIVMPNLKPPVVRSEQAAAYRERILAARGDSDFTPLMTAYLTDTTDPDDLAAGHAAGVFTAAKLYPAGATTNSASGVTDLDGLSPVLERMEAIGMPLLVHGEVTDAHVDIFDREARFLDELLEPLVQRFSELKVVVEHATTKESVEFVRAHDKTGCTITPQHLLANRNDMLVGGIRPHFYCLPILKRRLHQEALLEAATSGDPRFFLGTDSAPHSRATKETSCGCAGCFNAPAAIELYAEAFDGKDALDKLEGFASLHGPAFYRLEPNSERVTLVREDWVVPDSVAVDGPAAEVIPFYAGRTLRWRLER